ncbi:unnamed protein product, partial [Prunus brigantina]
IFHLSQVHICKKIFVACAQEDGMQSQWLSGHGKAPYHVKPKIFPYVSLKSSPHLQEYICNLCPGGWDAKPMVEWTREGTLPSQVESIPASRQLGHALEDKSPY